MTFGPYGFHNEPFFAPSLTLPRRNLRVTALMMQREMFESSLLRQAVFPWSLQSDVDMGALYLRDAVSRMRPRYIFPGDSIAVLMIAKVKQRQQLIPFFLKKKKQFVLGCFHALSQGESQCCGHYCFQRIFEIYAMASKV